MPLALSPWLLSGLQYPLLSPSAPTTPFPTTCSWLPGRVEARATYGRGAGGRTSDPGMDGRHQWPRGKQESPGAHGPSAAAGGCSAPPPCPLAASPAGAGLCVASRGQMILGVTGRAGGCHASSPVASPSAGLLKVTRAVRLPANSPSQEGPAGPGRPSLPPVLAWPRSGSHTRHLPRVSAMLLG